MSSAPGPAPPTTLRATHRTTWLAAAAGAGVGALSVLALMHLHRRRARSLARQEAARMAAPPTRSEVVIMGCGSSTGVPRAACLTAEDPSICKTCTLAAIGPPEHNRNWRSNPSLLIRVVRPPSAEAVAAAAASGAVAPAHSVRNIVIDIGKTWLSSALRWYPRLGVRSLDAVLVSHEHADAVLGFDDVRSMQHLELVEAGTMPRLPVHVSAHTLRSMHAKFNYLCDEAQVKAALSGAAAAAAAASSSPAVAASAGVPSMLPGAAIVERKVAQLDWSLMRPFVPFSTCGLDVMPLPVLHGEDYVSLGFLFGAGLGCSDNGSSEACLYISDVSRVPQATWNYLCTGVLPAPPPEADASSPQQRAAFFERFGSKEAHPLPSEQSSWQFMPDMPRHPDHHAAASSTMAPAAAASSSTASAVTAAVPLSSSPVAPRISLLVIDALFPLVAHNTHFNLEQALQFIERLRPSRALITGMSDWFEYGEHNELLRRRRAGGELTIPVELAYDGMRIPLRL